MPKSINERLVEDTNLTNPLVLSRPVLINGVERSEFAWDADGLTVEEWFRAAQRSENAMRLPEHDVEAQFYLGCAIIAVACPEVDAADLKSQVTGADIMRVGNLGRFFLYQWAAPEGDDSDRPSDGTPTSTRPPSESSGDSPSESS